MVNRAKPRVRVTVGVYRGGELLQRSTMAQNVVKIGRDPRSHVRVEDEAASRVHAILEVVSPSDIVLIDLGHPNGGGTLLNGERVDKCKVRLGDALRIGSTTLIVEDVVAAPAHETDDADGRLDPAPLAVSYALSATGPAVDADDVETRKPAVEVTVLWGSTVVDLVHLAPPRPFFVGDDSRDGVCDCLVPSGAFGTGRAPLIVTSEDGDASLVLWPNAVGTMETPGQGKVSLAELVASGRAMRSSAAAGAYEVPLVQGARAFVQIGMSISFAVHAVRAGKRLPLGAMTDPETLLYTGASFLVHAGLFAALAFLMPHMNGDTTDAFDRDRVLAMQRLLNAAAEREREAVDQPTADATPEPSSGSTGASAKGASGAMGTPITQETGRRYGVQGPKDNPDPHLARLAALNEAATFTLTAYLLSHWAGDPNAPTATWGREESLGQDAVSARGSMFGDRIGDAAGNNGLGPTGMEEGGGGHFENIGLDEIGPLGHGVGGRGPEGIGSGGAPAQRGHKVRAPHIRDSVTTVNGRLPPEIIQRTVRQNFGRFRYCYEKGLHADPELRGRVAVKFIIDRTGAVAMAADGGSDLPDRDVVQCVVTGFTNLSFPPPEGGVVTVVYPIVLSPGD